MENSTFNWKKQEIENQAKQKLSSLGKQEIEAAAKKYKKMEIIFLSVTIFYCIAIILTMSILWSLPEESVPNEVAIFMIVISIAGIIASIIGIYKIFKKPMIELALLQIKSEVRKSIAKLPTQQVVEKNTNKDFVATKAINILSNGLKNANKLLIDNDHKLFVYQNGDHISKAYGFTDLINYEVYENGQSKVKGRAGAALIGGAFFGLTGLIVGSSMGRQISKECTQLKLIMRINDINQPQIVITYIDNVGWNKNKFSYGMMKENIQEVCSALEYILNAKTLEQSMLDSQSKQSIENKQDQSLKKKLQELKELLNDGLITQDEFEQKKKQILNL